MIASLTTIDSEFTLIDRRELAKAVWDKMRLDADIFERIFPEEKAKESADAQEEGSNPEEKTAPQENSKIARANEAK